MTTRPPSSPECRRRAGRGRRPRAPRGRRPAITSAAGELRASRTFGLNATPRTPTRAPLSARPRSLSASADQVDDVPRHREVDVAGQLDEAIDKVELARPPRQVVRVDRDAVAADTWAGREPHEPERLGRGRVDDFPDVDAHPLAEERELVDERDVHVPEDVLEELRELRRIGRARAGPRVVDAAEQCCSPPCRPGSCRRQGAGSSCRR